MDLVVDDAMHPPADQSSRPGKENGNQFFRTGHWTGSGNNHGRSGSRGQGPCFSQALIMGNKLIKKVSDQK